MARPKKIDDKAKDSTNITHISINDFLETRNTVVTGLSTLQSAISDLSRSYLNHTDNLIGNRSGSLAFANVPFPDNGFFSARGPTPAPGVDAPPETKKRKRAPHDKNAPKRALTPFFLYLQSARPEIAEEMGQGHTAKEVQDEGGRRWREMPENEKVKWTEQYGINFARYKERMKAYKAGLPIPEISDGEAQRLYEQNKDVGKVPDVAQMETTLAPVERGEDDDDDDDDDESETSEPSSTDDESSEPAKAPSPIPASKKQKVTNAMKKKALAAEPEPVLDPALREPEKKKPGKKAKAAQATAEPEKAAADTPAVPAFSTGEKQKKKKRKSAAAE